MDVSAFRDSIGDRAPALSQIRRFENVRLEIIQPVTIDCDVGRGRVVRRRVDNRDRAPLRHLWCNVRPVFAVIGRDVDQPVIRSGPKRSLFFGRFSQRENGVVIFHARDVVGERDRHLAAVSIYRFSLDHC